MSNTPPVPRSPFPPHWGSDLVEVPDTPAVYETLMEEGPGRVQSPGWGLKSKIQAGHFL